MEKCLLLVFFSVTLGVLLLDLYHLHPSVQQEMMMSARRSSSSTGQKLLASSLDTTTTVAPVVQQRELAFWNRAESEFEFLATSQDPVTDKVTTHHYQLMYGMYLGPIRHLPVKMLEIGLGCDMNYGPGASTKVWQKWLPRAEIWQAELNGDCVDKARNLHMLDEIKTLVGDQGNPEDLKRWIEESGGNFDFIIDDGGHTNQMIKLSFDTLWPTIKPGGYYFIEDMQVGRERHQGNFGDHKPENTKNNMFDTWIDQLLIKKEAMADVIESWVDQLTVLPHSGRNRAKYPLPPDVSHIFCQREACVVAKSGNTVF